MPAFTYAEGAPTYVSNVVLDARQIIRDWKLSFSGGDVLQAEEILKRIQEMRRNTIVSDNDLLGALPDLLTDVALKWHRQERDAWTTWGEFEAAFREQYGDEEFQDNLRIGLKERTQGDGEPITDFIVQYRNLLTYVSPPYSLRLQLDKTYRNLRPEYRKRIARSEFTSFQELRNLGRQLEATENAYFLVLSCSRFSFIFGFEFLLSFVVFRF